MHSNAANRSEQQMSPLIFRQLMNSLVTAKCIKQQKIIARNSGGGKREAGDVEVEATPFARIFSSCHAWTVNFKI